jgi:hypothetical protein
MRPRRHDPRGDASGKAVRDRMSLRKTDLDSDTSASAANRQPVTKHLPRFSSGHTVPHRPERGDPAEDYIAVTERGDPVTCAARATAAYGPIEEAKPRVRLCRAERDCGGQADSIA